MVFMKNDKEQIEIAVVGSGTAGFVAALLLKTAFPVLNIKLVSSSKIGIIGVGEGSTEHWKQFMNLCKIPLLDMIKETDATHKYGIRFENWSNAHPDYFHSVSGDDQIFAYGLFPMYMGFIDNNMLLTNQTTSVGLIQNKIRVKNLHENTNQYHFDTNKLNKYFDKLCFERRIEKIDGEVKHVNINTETGNIDSIDLDDNTNVVADFWFDATGFNRVLMTALGNTEWESFKDYLLCDSAFAFPTESDPSKQIRPYTRARALSSGWAFEIPTVARRGNGYVYSSQHITEDKAVDEMSALLGIEVQPSKTFKFDPGYLKKSWVKNCASVGLSSSFVEPLEATSIGTSIMQMMMIVPYVASYQSYYEHSQNHYNKRMEAMMDNILTMIRLHYHTDKTNSQFWIDAKNAKLNEELEDSLNLWKERTPTRYDFPNNSNQLFGGAHLIHVAQGQNVINRDSIDPALVRMQLKGFVGDAMSQSRINRSNHELIDHREALENIDVWQ
jgi:tryptophan halogenase